MHADHEAGLALLEESQKRNKPTPLAADGMKTLPYPKSRPPLSAEELKRRQDESNRQEAQRLENARLANVAAALIPPRLRHHTELAGLTDKDHPWSVSLVKLESRCRKGFLVGLLGGYGTGKSQLGASLIDRAVTVAYTARFSYAYELFDSVMDLMRADEGKIEAVLRRFSEPSLLVLDEVNRGMSENDVRYVQRVVCKRYDLERDTLLISNEKAEDYADVVGPRIMSRMQECGGIVRADWPSFREKEIKTESVS